MVKLTFICSFDDDARAITELLDHLKQQTLDRFEVYLIANDAWKKTTIIDDYFEWKKDPFWKKHLKLMVNSQNLGLSYNYNMLLHKLKNTYFTFLHPNSRLDLNFVAAWAESLELCQQTTNHWPDLMASKPANSLYAALWPPHTQPKVLATKAHFDLTLVLPLFENKIYASRLVQLHQKDLYFRPFSDAYLLFLYKYVAQTTYLVTLNATISHPVATELNLLEIYKQWQHIFNYYRLNNLYETHLQQLNYVCVLSYLLMYYDQIVTCDNPVIEQKIRHLISRKVRRIQKHFATNPYFQKSQLFNFGELFRAPAKYLTKTKNEQLFE